MTKTFIIGVDVGGTFTDIFALDEAAGSVTITKIPSTRGDQSKGFVEGIGRLVPDFSTIRTVVHGTTVGTNALLERKGGHTGIITTQGFRDVLEMRRRDRPKTWGLDGTFTPVIDRADRLEVTERTLASGEILEHVDPEAVKSAARQLLDQGCEAVCVFFMNGYANGENERIAVEAVRSIWPSEHVTSAVEILPEIREFERASTASLNAYLQPVVTHYLDRLEKSLRASGFDGEILIVQSNGGVMAIEQAKALPVKTALSGPAAGVMAARHIGETAGFKNIITCDMGGTSFDVSMIADGRSALAAQTAIDFGMVIRSPMIEITTIGAGGGSIAWIDRGGMLCVGPESAGSNPGPVCYGLGNTRPTVTDANLVLGRINAAKPIGGKLDRLDVEAARAAIQEHVAGPLGMDVLAAAEAIIRVANARMAGAIRLVSIERGLDPNDFAAMPFGGGGALHTGALIQEVGVAKSLVPRYPGVVSALGCVVADMRHDNVRTINQPLATLDPALIGAEIARMDGLGRAALTRANVAFEAVERLVELDMLYVGQTHTVPVAIDADDLSVAAIQARFDDSYRAIFGRLLEGVPARVMNLRVTLIGRRPKFDLRALAPAGGKAPEDCVLEMRDLYADGQLHKAPVYDRLALAVGARVTGPCLLEQPDTTIFVDPGLTGVVDACGNLVIERI
ncbi:hydantoinase/oxoprolinase family protein [Gemmobacter nectariphilus]|uniref:hydantoinase/oxoprolinase family protein n=1 Tax=Gemmobacter nectariphilus TaxID=220343 RepID=UPI0004293AEF|nr:hydantoinase/oxoprolinase family protein [Gemmobacter nectariphilus]